MPAFICKACGTQFAPTDRPPAACPVCDDERQFVPPGGQSWTTHEALASSHYNAWRQLEPNLLAAVTLPTFAIGQRAELIRTPRGNFLWDCLSLCDAATVEIVKALGGLEGIAISHPHYYSSMTEWSRAFGGAPIHLHAADRQWIMRQDSAIALWDGETKELAGGLTLIRCGGHFPGGTVLHWADGAGGRGALLSGDVVQVVLDRKSVSFMRSYPNYIPLSAAGVKRIVDALAPLRFEAIHGAFPDRSIAQDGKGALQRSAERYLAWIGGDGRDELL